MSKSKQFEEIPEDVKKEMLMLVEAYSKTDLINKLRSLRESPSPHKTLDAIAVESTILGDSQPFTRDESKDASSIHLEQSNLQNSSVNPACEMNSSGLNNVLNNLKVNESINSSLNPVVVLQKIDIINANRFLSETHGKKKLIKNENLTVVNNMQAQSLSKSSDKLLQDSTPSRSPDKHKICPSNINRPTMLASSLHNNIVSGRINANKQKKSDSVTTCLSFSDTQSSKLEDINEEKISRKSNKNKTLQKDEKERPCSDSLNNKLSDCGVYDVPRRLRKNRMHKKTPFQFEEALNSCSTENNVNEVSFDVHAKSKSLKNNTLHQKALKKNLEIKSSEKQDSKRVTRLRENSDEQNAEAYSKLSKTCSQQGLNLDDIFRRKETKEMIEKYETNTEAIVFIGSHRCHSTGTVEPIINVHKSKKILLETLAAVQVKNGVTLKVSK